MPLRLAIPSSRCGFYARDARPRGAGRAARVVDAVEVTGLWRTQEFVVLRELPWKPGERVAPEAWDSACSGSEHEPLQPRQCGARAA